MDATTVVVTDRIDLDKQIYNTFLRTLSTITTPVRAESVKVMAELLSKAQPQIIMTTIANLPVKKKKKKYWVTPSKKSALQYEKPFPV